jgi:hypothetical protein
MLVGTGDPAKLEDGAPTMDALDASSVTFADAVFMQALFEMRSESMCEMLPPALHPTLPPVAGISVFDVPDSEWGSFRMAQLRIECRSGLRPRGLLVGAVIDNSAAEDALTQRFGFKLSAGDVELRRAYDETRVSVVVDGHTWLRTSMRGPTRIGEGDTQFVSSLHSARTPQGFRLVQVDTRHTVHRAERAPLEIEMFDAGAWGEERIVPSLSLPGVVGVADLSIDPLRFVCRPDVLAFQGTEAIETR